MEPWLDDLADDLQSLSFTSTSTTTINRSTSSGSASNSGSSSLAPSAHGSFSSKPLRSGSLSLADLRFALRLGSGDIGSVYLAELKSPPPPPPPDTNATNTNKNNGNNNNNNINNNKSEVVFAAKVMDKKELASRSKEGRARTEREILELLDHPFLPSLYAAIDSPKWLCLLTEFCPGGDLHVLRQRQPLKRFPESAVRVIDRVEMGSQPGGVSGGKPPVPAPQSDYPIDHPPFTSSSCIIPNCIVPAVSCFHPKRKRKKKTGHRGGPEFVAEPIDVRSMSFVGTHEYLAPEIVSGEGHGSPVDWWTLGIFMYELFYGVTPFKGVDHELTLANIVARALEFPKEPIVPAAAKDLISQLLVKDPARRLGSTMGASAIKHHPFFQGVNWALLRCTHPPYVPPPFSREVVSDESCPETPVDYY
ncbi:Protein kinase domain - like 10 [Theobroma cacao]|nr:Protein kinase domain - like 10 [Theobroma cacao]WRX33170.1 Protein kinase domain - like 10 [Theobroma cacao]